MNKRQGMNWCRKSTRLAIYVRDGFACVYCGAGIETAKLTLDHIKPRSQGGSNGPRNLVTCCDDCNCTRNDRPLDVFLTVWNDVQNVPLILKRVASFSRRSMTMPRCVALEILANRCPWRDALLKAVKAQVQINEQKTTSQAVR